MMQAANTPRPVQLQVNLAGAWKTILNFDAGNATAFEQVQQGAQMLHEAAPSTTSFRIATRDRQPVVLSYLGQGTYGLWMDAKLTGETACS